MIGRNVATSQHWKPNLQLFVFGWIFHCEHLLTVPPASNLSWMRALVQRAGGGVTNSLCHCYCTVPPLRFHTSSTNLTKPCVQQTINEPHSLLLLDCVMHWFTPPVLPTTTNLIPYTTLWSTAVEQVVACALVMQQAQVRSPVGTSFLGEVFSGFFLTCKTNVRKL